MLVIRQIRATEAARLRALRLQAIHDSPTAYAVSLAAEEAAGAAHWESLASRYAAGDESIVFVVEDGDDWVGMVGSFLHGAEGSPTAELIAMWINPAYRRLALGTQLVHHVSEWARRHGAKQVALWVTEGNEQAANLYTRCGFRWTDEAQPLPSHPALVERRMLRDL